MERQRSYDRRNRFIFLEKFQDCFWIIFNFCSRLKPLQPIWVRFFAQIGIWVGIFYPKKFPSLLKLMPAVRIQPRLPVSLNLPYFQLAALQSANGFSHLGSCSYRKLKIVDKLPHIFCDTFVKIRLQNYSSKVSDHGLIKSVWPGGQGNGIR